MIYAIYDLEIAKAIPPKNEADRIDRIRPNIKLLPIAAQVEPEVFRDQSIAHKKPTPTFKV